MLVNPRGDLDRCHSACNIDSDSYVEQPGLEDLSLVEQEISPFVSETAHFSTICGCGTTLGIEREERVVIAKPWFSEKTGSNAVRAGHMTIRTGPAAVGMVSAILPGNSYFEI